MLLTITTTYSPATDLGFLLHKNPAEVQSFELSFGQADAVSPTRSEIGVSSRPNEVSQQCCDNRVKRPRSAWEVYPPDASPEEVAE